MKKLSLFVFIDGFGWEVYKKHGFNNKAIDTRKKLKTTFGFSSGADPSILTGRYPDEHTHWSSFYYDPKNSPFKFCKYLSFLPKRIFDRFRPRHYLSRAMKFINGYTGYFEIYSVPFAHLPYFDYLEKHDYFVPNGILKTDTIFDWCVQNDIPYHCSNWRKSETYNINALKEKIDEGDIEFSYLYLPTLDGVMHTYGTEHEKTVEKIKWLEDQISNVYDYANDKYDEVSLHIFSDHGMCDTQGSVDLIKVIENTGLVYGKDYVAMYDSTMARFWFMNDEARETIEDLLSFQSSGKIVDDDELKEMRVFFEDRRFGELFFLTNPGILINPSYFGLQAIPGMHGFHPDHKDSHSLMFSSTSIDENINSITDIRKVMEKEIRDEK
ncbi:alkaline phosphatase family protein [Poseidonibacter lekithochrous]|uniref:alkaline phosphatase family protein n=1 Tax=Poseidonibacter lekithochrous TaxID=1904463 RepID=UPI00196B055D|nr:alkaline phosphatase family protein [Poseidonibacter lekithochrous]